MMKKKSVDPQLLYNILRGLKVLCASWFSIDFLDFCLVFLCTVSY